MTDTENQMLGTRNSPAVVNSPSQARPAIRRAFATLIGKRFDHALDGIREGQLVLTWPDGRVSVHGERTEGSPACVSVSLHNLKPLWRLMVGGEIGFAESYLRGEWSCDSLTGLFDLIVRNENHMAHAVTGTWLSRGLNLLGHWQKRNSRTGSQRNIAYHYDLGNAFYQLWLDETMSYSAALYAAESQSLADAQRAKMQRVAELLQPAAGARVLEIGCGWGAMAHWLATRSACQVTGISLSSEQLDYARRHHEVPGQTCFRYQDYRDVTGRFQHIVSIEMFEAVGIHYWQTYFARVAELLEQGGTAVLQVITILEARFEAYRRTPDYIQRYIFPGGMLPTKTRLQELVEEAGLVLEGAQWFGQSYARTLAAWYERFEHSSREVLHQGFDERFLRMWRYYLAYCEAGFRSGTTDVGLLQIRKP